MAGLTLLRLDTPPRIQERSDQLSEWVTPVQAQIHRGTVFRKVPAVVTACSARLAAALSAGAPPATVRPWIPWLAARLVTDGEAVLIVRVRDGMPVLVPARVVHLRGRLDALRYDVEIPGPDRTVSLNGLTPDSVAHLKLHPDGSRPWRGRSWLDVSGPDGLALARLVLRFGEETLGPTGKVLSRIAGAPGSSVDWYKETSKNLSAMRGGVSVLGDNVTQVSAPPAKFRLGVDVPGPVITLYEKLGAAVAQSLGFPPQLVGIVATGATARRDTLATWVRGVVAGWVSSWSAELERVLETDLEWNMAESLQADNLPGRIRGAATLRTAGWSAEDAERLAGL